MKLITFALKRTGQHAIINWICRQLKNVVHYNNCMILSYDKWDKPRIAPRGSPIEYGNPESKLWSFENVTVSNILDVDKKIVIVRDPLNTVASQNAVQFNMGFNPSIWFNHIEHFDDDDVVGINFNRWFADKTYRENIAILLDIKFTDEGKEEVYKWGGSGFDGYDYDGKASEMSVLTRYKSLDKNEIKEYQQYQNIYIDKFGTKWL